MLQWTIELQRLSTRESNQHSSRWKNLSSPVEQERWFDLSLHPDACWSRGCSCPDLQQMTIRANRTRRFVNHQRRSLVAGEAQRACNLRFKALNAMPTCINRIYHTGLAGQKHDNAHLRLAGALSMSLVRRSMKGGQQWQTKMTSPTQWDKKTMTNLPLSLGIDAVIALEQSNFTDVWHLVRGPLCYQKGNSSIAKSQCPWWPSAHVMSTRFSRKSGPISSPKQPKNIEGPVF